MNDTHAVRVFLSKFTLKEKVLLLLGSSALILSFFLVSRSDIQDTGVDASVQSLALAADQGGSVYCANGVLTILNQDASNATMRVRCETTATPTPVVTPTLAPPTATPTLGPTTTPVTSSCSNPIARSEVSQHTSPDTDCWVIIYDKVYNVSKNNTDGVDAFKGGSHHGRVATDTSCGNDLTDAIPTSSKGFVDESKHFSGGNIDNRVQDIFDLLCIGTVSG